MEGNSCTAWISARSKNTILLKDHENLQDKMKITTNESITVKQIQQQRNYKLKLLLKEEINQEK